MKDKINGLPRETVLQVFADYDSGKTEADAALFSIRKILQAAFEEPFNPSEQTASSGGSPVGWGDEKEYPTEKPD